jgi:hypothetical protein
MTEAEESHCVLHATVGISSLGDRVLACGPSLNDYDLSRIDPYPSIGVNRVIRVYTPTYLLFIDPPIIQELEPWLHIGSELIGWDNGIKNCNYPQLPKVRKHLKTFRQFRGHRSIMSNKYEGLIFGNTTTHAALHFAYILGGDPIVILGVDLKFRGDKYHFYSDEAQIKRTRKGAIIRNPRDKPKVEKTVNGKTVVMRQENERMKMNLDRICKVIRDKGTRVYQCYKDSLLAGAIYKSLDDVLEEVAGEAMHEM